MSEAKFIEVVFENLESIVIPMERILEFEFGELTSLTEDFFEENSYQSDHIELIIKYNDDSELKYNPLDYDEPLGMFINNPTSNNVKDRPNILGRLINHKDIVDISLLNENQEDIKIIYVPWSGKSDYNNEAINVKTDKGILEIEIKK